MIFSSSGAVRAPEQANADTPINRIRAVIFSEENKLVFKLILNLMFASDERYNRSGVDYPLILKQLSLALRFSLNSEKKNIFNNLVSSGDIYAMGRNLAVSITEAAATPDEELVRLARLLVVNFAAVTYLSTRQKVVSKHWLLQRRAGMLPLLYIGAIPGAIFLGAHWAAATGLAVTGQLFVLAMGVLVAPMIMASLITLAFMAIQGVCMYGLLASSGNKSMLVNVSHCGNIIKSAHNLNYKTNITSIIKKMAISREEKISLASGLGTIFKTKCHSQKQDSYESAKREVVTRLEEELDQPVPRPS